MTKRRGLWCKLPANALAGGLSRWPPVAAHRQVALRFRRRREDAGVPTLVEQGLSEFEVPITLGLFAPGATPAALVRTLNQDARAVMHEAETRAWMQKNIVSTTDLSAQAFRERMAREIAVFTEVAARAQIQLN